MRALAIALLLSVIFTAGCVGQDGVSLPGLENVKPSRTTSSIGLADIVAMESVRTIPEKSVLAGSSLRLFMNVVSKETDLGNEAKSVYVNIFDPFIFKQESEPTECTQVNPCDLRAGETKFLHWEFSAPSRDAIANVITKGSIKYLLQYDFSSATNYEVIVVNPDEILKLQQEGKTLSIPASEVRTSGPIQLELSQPVPFAMASSGYTSQPTFITLKIRNRGLGSPFGGTGKSVVLPEGTVNIAFHGLGTVECPKDFERDADGCKNAGDIIFIRQESIPYLFKISGLPLLSPEVPFKTFLVTAKADYTYEIRGQADVEIQPGAA
jgi:hypothetical protein